MRPVAKGMPHPRLPGIPFLYGSAVLQSVPGYPGIAASTRGDIWSIRSGRWYKLKTHPGGGRESDSRNGYLRVSIRVDGRTYAPYVHHLAALAWKGPRPDDSHEVDHRDWDHLNNKPDNLRYLPNGEHQRLTRDHNPDRMTDEDWEAIL